jgi:hypothetical protein
MARHPTGKRRRNQAASNKKPAASPPGLRFDCCHQAEGQRGQTWFATVHEVLQADWQELWQVAHFSSSSTRFRLAATTVLM